MDSQKLSSFGAVFYDLTFKLGRYQAAINYFLAQLPFGKDDPVRVLDLGCGTGLFSLAVLRNFPYAKVTACDLNPAMIKIMERRLLQGNLTSRSTVFMADIRELNPELVWAYDLVITSGVLEYTPIESTVPLFSTYMAPGGCFLNVPTKHGPFEKFLLSRLGFKSYSSHEVIQIFTENGLRLSRKIILPWRHFPICLAKEGFLFQFP